MREGQNTQSGVEMQCGVPGRTAETVVPGRGALCH